jgi:hypothetical protein
MSPAKNDRIVKKVLDPAQRTLICLSGFMTLQDIALSMPDSIAAVPFSFDPVPTGQQL